MSPKNPRNATKKAPPAAHSRRSPTSSQSTGTIQGKEGAGRNLGEKGASKEERLSHSTRHHPATIQPGNPPTA